MGNDMQYAMQKIILLSYWINNANESRLYDYNMDFLVANFV